LIARGPAARLVESSGAAAGQKAGGALHCLTPDRSGERLDVFLARALPDCSRAAARRLIESGHVLVDGRAGKGSQRLSAGARVEAIVPPPRPSALSPEPMPLDIVYEDAGLLVVNKPSGLVVHPSAGHAEGTLVHGLLAYADDLSGAGGEERPGIVHRLDRDTSGLLMVAKNDHAHAALSRQLQERTVRKFYLALVHGVPRPERGVIDAPIGRDPRNRQRMAVLAGGRPARTGYAARATRGGYTLVVARLETGRTHQIRVHFAGMGCPVAGDPTYGRAGGPAGRLWLHAWRLELTRPSDAEKLQLEAPLPEELRRSWEELAGEQAPGELDRILRRARRWALAAEAAARPEAEETAR
jgi:23S rRNA pseudouridine1911/1915/1917 synthase